LLKSEHNYSETLRDRITKIQKRIGDKKELAQNFKEAKNLLKIYRAMNIENSSALRLVEHFERVSDKIKSL
jgi:hypothetical protein